MPTPLADLPKELVQADLESQSVSLQIDAALYPLSALYATAYIFLDRCFVLLDQPDATHFRATLSWKKAPSPPPAAPGSALEQLAGEFANELLTCAWRARIAADSRLVIETTTARALGGAMGPPSLDDLEGFDFGGDTFEDPLGIALSWEEKYGKKKKEDASAATATSSPGDNRVPKDGEEPGS